MAPATEIVTLTLKSGTNPEESSSPDYHTWIDLVRGISAADGFQGGLQGRNVESPGTMQVLIHWESVEAHQAFEQSASAKPVAQDLGSLLGAKPSLMHVNFKPYPPDAATSAPVTEIATLHLAKSESDAQETESAFVEAFQHFKDTAEKNAEGCRGIAGGWAVEELEYNGEKGKAFVGLLGWESVDAHKKYNETALAKETLNKLHDLSRGIEFYHVTLKPFDT